jgi:hypothetical protein
VVALVCKSLKVERVLFMFVNYMPCELKPSFILLNILFSDIHDHISFTVKVRPTSERKFLKNDHVAELESFSYSSQ